ncbi:Hypothetical predicted protein [Pelobates cultripes]|uniref:Uncharacterized protein n=1 Tax=Pelobates cultripes TaxID=61616 RepID=A0AAD1SI33_PELCU|nr:Hypothetical predicted protein [Pelobates cultripes]
MSVAIRKHRWEGPETQWMGLSPSFAVYDAFCCHRFTADNVRPAMEEHEALSEEPKETNSSSFKLFSVAEVNDIIEKQEPIPKEVNENDNLDAEGVYLSPDTSVETVVNVSIISEEHNFMETGVVLCQEETPSENVILQEGKMGMGYEKSEKCEISDISVGKKDTFEGEDDLDTNDENNKDSLNVLNFMSVIDSATEILSSGTDVGEIVTPGVQLIYSAVIAQQRRKSDAFKDGHGKKTCDVVLGNCSNQGFSLCSQALCETGPSSCFPLSSSTMLKENGVHKSEVTIEDVNENQKMLNPTDQCLQLKDNGATCVSGYEHVRLRRKKV